jgi:hypothetical protein
MSVKYIDKNNSNSFFLLQSFNFKTRIIFQMNKPKIRKNKNKKLKEILSGSNAHALPHLVGNQNKILKSIWLFFFLISIFACFYFLNRTFNDYFKYTKVTSIDIINEQPAIFPTIALCNRKAYGLPLNSIILCQTFFKSYISFSNMTSLYSWVNKQK